MSTWPFIGRFVQVGIGIIRLPNIKQRQFEIATVRLPSITANVAELKAELSKLEARFSEIDATPSELNSELSEIRIATSDLDAEVSGVTNGLSILNEELLMLKTGFSGLDTKIEELVQTRHTMENQLVQVQQTMEDQLTQAQHTMDSKLSEYDSIIETIDAQLPAQKNLVDSAPAAFRNIVRDIAELRGELANTSGTINYLDERIEFVRRELMYEMRYGASSQSGKSGGLKVETEILSPEKLKTARSEQIRLNLGCGHKPLEGYLNVDRRSLPGIDIVADVDELPFEKGEIDEIFSSHLLEHFPEEQLRRVLLRYWLNLLKPGGVFRAVVPDSDGMIKAYISGEYPFQRLRDVTYGAQDYDGDFHFNMFTTSSLSELLAEAGFVDINIIAENRENKGCKEFEISARCGQV